MIWFKGGAAFRAAREAPATPPGDPPFGWFRRDSARSVGQSRRRLVLPDDRTIIYAIGDVHGCLDLLLRVEEMIVADASCYHDRERAIVVLGDFIDRGTRSAEVVEHLMNPPPVGFSRFILAGNHEEAMLAFLDNPVSNTQWLSIGGFETLRSYGVPLTRLPVGRRELKRFGTLARAAIPDEQSQFIRSLPVAVVCGRFLFVHAGIRPNVPFERQVDRDLQEIRKEFTDSAADHGLVVVHGHTPAAEPVHHATRISLDVASYATGRLAAARIEKDGVEFFVASSRS